MDETRQLLDIDFMQLIYEDETVSIAECYVMHEGVNRNKCDISHDIILTALPTLANRPLWCIPNSYFKDSSTDFVEHARTDEQRKNILIFGVFPESSVKNAEFVEKDGKIYLKVNVVLFKIYAPIPMSILKNKGGDTKISIEIIVSGEQGDDGVLKVTKMKFLSAACLGDKIQEGIEGSEIDIIRFSLDESIKKSNEYYLKFIEDEKYKIPDKVKINVQTALKMRQQKGRGGNTEGISMANFLINNDYVDYKKILDISRYLFQHANDHTDGDTIGSSFISWNLAGGDEALEWTRKIIESKKNFDNKAVNNMTTSIETFVAKDLLGTKSEIKVDKSKKAMSDSPWGDEDKSDLKKKCLMASNWKSLCKDVFQKCEKEYLDGIEGALGYPVMEIKGDTAVYNRNGLSSAKAYATKNNETEVLAALVKIYKHLSLDKDDKNSKEDEKMGDSVQNAKVDEEEVDNKKNEEIIDNSKLKDKIDEEDKVDGGKDEKDEKEVDNAQVEDMCGKYVELEKECNSLKERIAKFERKEELEKMAALFADFSNCYSDDEVEVMKNSINTMTYAELDSKVSEKAKEFVKKIKKGEVNESKTEEKIENKMNFSISPFPVQMPKFSFTKEENVSLESIANNPKITFKK